jgi:hypothetical protein
MTQKYTAKDFFKEKERRELGRQELAKVYDEAADILIEKDQFKFRGVASLLRNEAMRWRNSE